MKFRRRLKVDRKSSDLLQYWNTISRVGRKKKHGATEVDYVSRSERIVQLKHFRNEEIRRRMEAENDVVRVKWSNLKWFRVIIRWSMVTKNLFLLDFLGNKKRGKLGKSLFWLKNLKLSVIATLILNLPE